MRIQEDSKVVIRDCSGNQDLGNFVPNVDVEIEPNSIILVDGELCCIERINKISDGEYQIDVYWQDAVLAKDGRLFSSINDD